MTIKYKTKRTSVAYNIIKRLRRDNQLRMKNDLVFKVAGFFEQKKGTAANDNNLNCKFETLITLFNNI